MESSVEKDAEAKSRLRRKAGCDWLAILVMVRKGADCMVAPKRMEQCPTQES